MQSGRIQSDGICSSCKVGENNKMGFAHHAKLEQVILLLSVVAGKISIVYIGKISIVFSGRVK